MNAEETFSMQNMKDSVKYHVAALSKGIEQQFNYYDKTALTLLDALNDVINMSDEPEVQSDCLSFDEIKSKCRNFPSEWTILQFTRQFNSQAHTQNYHDNITENCSIFITVLTHFIPKRPFSVEPFTIEVPASLTTAAFYTKVFKWIKFTSDNLTQFPDRIFQTEEERIKAYRELLRQMKADKEEVILHMRAIMGPWICLFRGRPKSSTQRKKDEELFCQLDAMCDGAYTPQQQLILFLLARSADLLTTADIRIALEQIRLQNTSIDFLAFYQSLKTGTAGTEFFPTLLIVDDVLDHIPWEMMIPSLEITRLFSFDILCKLFETHKNSIQDGYFVKSFAGRGGCVINPEANLDTMEKRMKQFLGYCLPAFELISRRKPQSEEMVKLLKQHEVYLYLGHGSGLQFLDGIEILELELNAIAFLFGCSSVSFQYNGPNNPLIGSHLFYHMAHCPTVVGFNYIALDIDSDMAATYILSKFFMSQGKNNWSAINTHQWKLGNIVFNEEKPPEFQGNLQAIIAEIRSNPSVSGIFKLEPTVIIRGLPVLNNYKKPQKSKN